MSLDNFIGFETGGLEEAVSITNSPSVQSVIVRTGSYALELAGNASVADYEIDVIASGNQVVHGFAVRFTDVAPTNDVDFWQYGRGTNRAIRLRLKTTGDLKLVDSDNVEIATETTPFTADKWHYIEIFWYSNPTTGQAIVDLDGVEIISVSTQNFEDDTGVAADYFTGTDTATEDIYFDDYYRITNANDGDFLGPKVEVLGAYQNTVEDATDQGSALNNGTWADVGELPLVDGTQADYEQTGAIEGFTICDEGNRAGPAGDAPGTITGAKYIQRMARTNGSSPTTLDKSFGNNSDGVTAVDVAATLTAAFQNLFVVSEAAGVVPTNSENFAMGMGQTGSGGRDVLAHEMMAFLLHVQPALSTTLADLNFPDQNYYLGPFGT